MARRKAKPETQVQPEMLEVQPEVLDIQPDEQIEPVPPIAKEAEIPKPVPEPVKEVKVSIDLCICGSGKPTSECCVKKYIR